jgi:diacylglycerol O-acyltransferase / wax synthase
MTARSFKERDLHFEDRMSDAEALMWNVEKDPWLNPSGGVVIILDRPVDFARFQARLRGAVAAIPRLRERVVPGLGRLSAPVWRTDPEFDFDHHVRHVMLPAPGGRRELYDLATRLYEDPYDRTRPLWQFFVIDGLANGEGALFWKTHHSITDGIGAVRLAEQYMDIERSPGPVAEVDLDAALADARAAEHDDSAPAGDLLRATRTSVAPLAGRALSAARRFAGEAAIWPADPTRPVERAASLARLTRVTLSDLLGSSGDHPGGSPLWANRSRHRHLEALSLPLPDVKTAAKALGGTVNDAFLTGITGAASRYHAARGVTVEWFNGTFVVSTRDDDTIGGNSFTPTRVQLPGGPMPVAERFAEVHRLVAAKRARLGGGNALGGLASIANLLPTSLVTGMARAQAARVDFATSNFRAAPFEVYVAGAKIRENYTIGPVAGTAFNVTTMSYNDTLFLGVNIDPVAVADPDALRQCLEAAFADLLRVGGVRRRKKRT